MTDCQEFLFGKRNFLGQKKKKKINLIAESPHSMYMNRKAFFILEDISEFSYVGRFPFGL